MQFQDPDFKVVQKGVIDKLEKEGNVHYDPDWYNDFNKYMINTLGSEVEASYKYYIEEDYFGKSYKELIEFFSHYEPKGTVLDLGCGQGRDSIEIAKLGYNVTGVDISIVGINQMILKANALNLNLIGIADDIYKFDRINEFDIILLDSMLHFYKNDKKKETEFLEGILKQMKEGSIFCNLLMKSKANEKYLKSIVSSFKAEFEIVLDDYAQYPEANCDYHMYVIKKL